MDFTAEIRTATDPIYQKISKVMPEIEWSVHAPYIHRINQLKKEKNAIILAHNYQTPEIYHGIADVAADSLALAIEASKTEADIIVMAGVHFMAETSKLMSPEKKVLLPDMAAGCSLSSSITGKDVLNKSPLIKIKSTFSSKHILTAFIKACKLASLSLGSRQLPICASAICANFILSLS